LNCRECNDFLIDYLNGDLPPGQLRIFEGHIELCPPCLTYLESYRETLKLAQKCGDEQSEPLPEALVSAILAARAEGKPTKKA
jgi:anti-sigma factor RsiW